MLLMSVLVRVCVNSRKEVFVACGGFEKLTKLLPIYLRVHLFACSCPYFSCMCFFNAHQAAARSAVIVLLDFAELRRFQSRGSTSVFGIRIVSRV